MTDKLKSCPFCGGEVRFTKRKSSYDGTIFYGVQCVNTGCCEIPPVYTETAAISKWNTRKPMDKIVEQLEQKKFIRVEQCHEDYECITEGHFDDAIEIVEGVQNE